MLEAAINPEVGKERPAPVQNREIIEWLKKQLKEQFIQLHELEDCRDRVKLHVAITWV